MRGLSKLSTFDKDRALRVVIETPKGSHNKYAYDPNFGGFALKKVLPEGMTFPYDFGFIPSTKGEDGDPLDILVLMDFPVIPGCVVAARLIGAIQARQKDEGHDWIENDRLIAVASVSRKQESVKTLKDLRPHLLDEIAEFFVAYNKQAGGIFRRTGTCDASGAMKLVQKGIRKCRR